MIPPKCVAQEGLGDNMTKATIMADRKELKKTTSMIDLVSRSKGSFVAPREVIKSIEVLAPQAVSTLEHLLLHSKSDSVRLKAAVEVLELAGVSKETRLTIKTDVKDMSEKEINERLNRLMGVASKTYLEGDYEDISDE